jgi:dolichol kinase
MHSWTELRSLFARKFFHVIFVALLAVPLFVEVPAELYIAALTLVGGFVYSIQVRQPLVWEEFRQNFFKSLEEAFTRLEQLLPLDRPLLRSQYQAAVRQLEELMLAAERDYEKRHGYLGILMGAVGFLVAVAIFGKAHLLASVVSMVVYDAVSAVVGNLLQGWRIAGKLTLWGTGAGALSNMLALVAVGYPAPSALLITAFVVLADALSPEDNLTIPPAAAAASYLSGPL